MNERQTLTLGSLFAGIGGFDLGFERAGWQTKWQVELSPLNRSVLADRFPNAVRHADVTHCGAHNLTAVDCITFGFPCQDISNMGAARKSGRNPGLGGPRSGLFFEAIRIIQALQPTWLVLENVPALLHSNDSKDFERVVQELAGCGYLGFARVLNARHFGIPQNRRRLFMVAGFGRYPSFEFLADAAPVDTVPCSAFPQRQPRAAHEFAGYTLTAKAVANRIDLGSEVLVAEEDGWSAMVERARSAALHGLPSGLDTEHWAASYGAGNAVCPQVAEWVARTAFPPSIPKLSTNL